MDAATDVRDAKPGTARRALRSPLGWVAAVVLAVVAFWMAGRARDAEVSLRRLRDTWAIRCEAARLRALDEISLAVGFARNRSDLGPTFPPGQTLTGFVRTCVGESRDLALEETASIGTLIQYLYMARKFEEIEALVADLRGTPFERWPSVRLPAQPPLELVVSGGDETAAKQIGADTARATESHGGSGAGGGSGSGLQQ